MSCYSLPRHIDVRAARNRVLPALEPRRAVNPTIRRPEALEEASTASSCSDAHLTAPLRTTLDTAKWVENEQLICWVTQQLGGTWPARAADVGLDNANESATPRRVLGAANGQTFPDESTATLENICGGSSLPLELLNPQARDALTALSENEHDSPTLNSDIILGVLNAGPAPVDVDTLFGAETHARDTATGGEDSWMAGLLSPQARQGLVALERYGRRVGDSEVLLNILNAGRVQGVSNQEACVTLGTDGVDDAEDAIAELIDVGFAALKARSAYGGNLGASSYGTGDRFGANVEATVQRDPFDFTNRLNRIGFNAIASSHGYPPPFYVENYSTDGATGLPLSPFGHTHASSQTSFNAPRLDDLRYSLWDFQYSPPPPMTAPPFGYGRLAPGRDGDWEESDGEWARYSDEEDELEDDDSRWSLYVSSLSSD